MPAKKRTVADLYPNRAFETVIQSAADTLTFSQIQFGVGLFQGVAAIIHRIEWFPDDTTMDLLNATNEFMEFALTNRDDLSSIRPTSQNVLAHKSIHVSGFGTPANAQILATPFISDFSKLGGGGLIIPSNPLYIGMDSTNLGAVGRLDCVVYLTFKELSDAEYVELIQTIMPANL